MSEDELRAKLTGALTSEMRGSAFEASAAPMADALMPVITEALARVWCDGFMAAVDDYGFDVPFSSKRDNPWRGEQP